MSEDIYPTYDRRSHHPRYVEDIASAIVHEVSFRQAYVNMFDGVTTCQEHYLLKRPGFEIWGSTLIVEHVEDVRIEVNCMLCLGAEERYR